MRNRHASSYSEKLRDPRWQKKRLQIMERDGWKCRFCEDASSTLNVHHMAYPPRVEPWDVPDELLVTLCEACHGQEGSDRPKAEAVLLQAMRYARLSAATITVIAEFIDGCRDEISKIHCDDMCDLLSCGFSAINTAEKRKIIIDDIFDASVNPEEI